MLGSACLQDYGLKSLKNCCEPEMGLMMTFCPLMKIRGVELVCQATGGTRLVVNSTLAPSAVMNGQWRWQRGNNNLANGVDVWGGGE